MRRLVPKATKVRRSKTPRFIWLVTASSATATQRFGSVSVSRNTRYGIFGVASFGLRAGELHNLTPLFGFLRDQLAEVSGRTRKHRAAEISDPRFHVGIAESRIDLLVQFVD